MQAFYDEELPRRNGVTVGSPRRAHLEQFVETCRSRGLRAALEVGAGGGHDGAVIQMAGFGYTGVDLSSVGVRLCRTRGLDGVQASATALPFAADSFDAAWSMSVLMHLPGEDMLVALRELHRVVRPGGLVEVGVWGADADGVFVDDAGRYFRYRTDGRMAEMLGQIGALVAFETWDHLKGGPHYQWGRMVVSEG